MTIGGGAVDAADWDERYQRAPLIWSAEPNRWVVEHARALRPGRMLDIAAGEGRNAVWFAELGWHALAVDFSGIALERAREMARSRLGAGADRVETLTTDVLTWEPPPFAFDLVLVCYLHVPAPQRHTLIARAAAGVAPGGLLLVIGHDARNLTQGYGGPQDAAVLYGPDDLRADLVDTGLTVRHSATEDRPVTDADGVDHVALDVVVLAERPAAIDQTQGDTHA
jgi:SAM-dependent methyltransferase